VEAPAGLAGLAVVLGVLVDQVGSAWVREAAPEDRVDLLSSVQEADVADPIGWAAPARSRSGMAAETQQ